jgi:glycosyltransferase involved in cell wall biosynthesis
MIFFDATKTGTARHHSGLTRVSTRLREELGEGVREVAWPHVEAINGATDWFLTTELFSEQERPGFSAWLEQRVCRRAAVFHDAIPLKLPGITWPQSVARHPGYMKLLSRFDRVWAVSEASRRELVDFWKWQRVEKIPPVDVLALGADFNRAPRVSVDQVRQPSPRPAFLCVGIIEPRKNQSLLLDVAGELWNEGRSFDLHLVGRVNPHFGEPIVARIRQMATRYPGLHFHHAADDATLAALYASARAGLFPTLAEGCGLPLLESLWMGVPCVCSDLPVLRENADAGGCLAVAVNDRGAWKDALRRLATDDALHARLAREAGTRSLPRWTETAAALRVGIQ